MQINNHAAGWDQASVAVVRRMYSEGKSDREIGDDLGRTEGAISNCRQKHQIQRPREWLKNKPWTPEEVRRLTALYEAGVIRSIICGLLGRSPVGVKHMAKLLGVRPLSPLPPPPPELFDTPGEEWRVFPPVPCYAVSTKGRVMSLRPRCVGKILKLEVDEDGYHRACLVVPGGNKRYPVHRMVALTFIGPPPSPVHQAAHNDGTRRNNVPSNLRWATPKENQADRLIHGTSNRKKAG